MINVRLLVHRLLRYLDRLLRRRRHLVRLQAHRLIQRLRRRLIQRLRRLLRRRLPQRLRRRLRRRLQRSPVRRLQRRRLHRLAHLRRLVHPLRHLSSRLVGCCIEVVNEVRVGRDAGFPLYAFF